MIVRQWIALLILLGATPALAQSADMAAAFGSREGVTDASLSPDGKKIAFVVPGAGQSTQVFVFDTVAGGAPKRILSATGNPDRIAYCQWVAAARLACKVWGIQTLAGVNYGFSSVVAVDDTGTNMRVLSQRHGNDAEYFDLRGGSIIDALPDQDGAVLMERSYVPESNIGSIVTKTAAGLGVDRIDTRTGATTRAEPAHPNASEFITDGRGNVRIMGLSEYDNSGYSKGRIHYYYRQVGSTGWKDLSILDYEARTGFNPYAVDADKNVAYGFEPIDGRQALVSVSLDGALTHTTLIARPDVDIDGLIRIGRRQRVVGASFETDKRTVVYFDPTLKALAASLGRALGGKQISIVDTSTDETRMLLWAGNDTDAGQYYLFDRPSKKLSPVIPERPQLAGVALAQQTPVTYKATDGTVIPGYLTLPAGSSGKGLPAIVLPHGGPEARDSWGFDWLSQYFAARGFAVFQPEFRGSAGYGQRWFMDNGYRSWRTSVGDVADAGRWLIAQGIADPAKLTVFGWSYGGYAALQSTVLAPGLFKAAVAVAPVTDLASLVAHSRYYSGYFLRRAQIGTGPHVKEGSPAQNVDQVTAPILMFHGTLDANVPIDQSRLMDARLRGAGKRSELVVFEGLDHQLEDSVARATMLRRAGDFLAAAGK